MQKLLIDCPTMRMGCNYSPRTLVSNFLQLSTMPRELDQGRVYLQLVVMMREFADGRLGLQLVVFLIVIASRRT